MTVRGVFFGAVICGSPAFRWRRPLAVLVVAAVATLLTGTSLVFGRHGWLGPEIIALNARSAPAMAAGLAVRNRRAYVAAVEGRARRAVLFAGGTVVVAPSGLFVLGGISRRASAWPSGR
ncbi:hypothetical protein [Streptomyces acidicola]|uniref:hypothetical protein n=1 Tax=Streptomyces acidicola TaxID=2596892 RepID=UPI0018848914|nr:hypothetical protein [Streptomyces acidicola]